MKRAHHRRCGFTLVEVLIVVVILGILASVVLPKFNRMDDKARETALVHDLQSLRSQITLYRIQHAGRFPGQGSTDPNVFKNALLLSSDAGGTVGPVGSLPLGPYIMGAFPVNPYNGGRGVLITSDVFGTNPNEGLTVGGEVVGWIYNPDEGHLKANAAGNSSTGVPLSRL